MDQQTGIQATGQTAAAVRFLSSASLSITVRDGSSGHILPPTLTVSYANRDPTIDSSESVSFTATYQMDKMDSYNNLYQASDLVA